MRAQGDAPGNSARQVCNRVRDKVGLSMTAFGLRRDRATAAVSNRPPALVARQNLPLRPG